MSGNVVPNPDRDVLSQLSEQLDALQDHVWEKVHDAGRGERNRLRLLYLHAAFALFTAPLFLVWSTGPNAFTGVTWRLLASVPMVEIWMPVLLFTGGAVLALATAARSPRWAALGLLMVLAWYLVIALSFFGSVFIWLDNGAPTPWPAIYAPLVYTHSAAIMVVHLRTVWSLIRSMRRG